MQMDRHRMGTRLGGWVAAVGVAWVRDGLGVSRQTVYRWLAGESVPSLEHAVKIERVSQGVVTVRDVIDHGKEVRDGARSDRR